MSATSNFLKKGTGAKYTLHRRPYTANCSKRIVPPFSIQSLQKNTLVLEPKFAKKFIIDRHNFSKPATSFRMYYDRGDLPIKMEYLIGGEKISWTVDIDKLDYTLYLPLFFDGLSETQHPYKTFARQGVQDLLSNGGDKIFPIIPQLIIPIKNALNTKNIEVMCTIMKVIQQLVTASDLVGPAMVPFYRQLLPVFNAYKTRNSKSCVSVFILAQKKY
ncbi:hypothetical protein ACKWTF_010692 [Chironomus riparius]